MPYNPALDGIRALAVLAVIAFHARVPGFSGGFIGVDVFFVLSGYLITSVLSDNANLRQFYWRRFLRLVPPLALMLAAYLFIAPIIWPKHPHFRDAALAFFYLSDYSIAFWTQPFYLWHTWSLSVEEHFYLLWPIVFLKLRPTVKVLFIAYIAATAWRWGWDSYHEAYHRFDTRMSGLILGCILAFVPRIKHSAWPSLLILGLAVVAFRKNDPNVQGLGFTLVELASAYLIIGQQPKWLSASTLVYVGRLSYGMYLWHYPIARYFRDDHAPWQVTLAASLVGSIICAAISYHTIEAWIRSRRRHFPKSNGEHGMPEMDVPPTVSGRRITTRD